jgi:hypothetical protein
MTIHVKKLDYESVSCFQIDENKVHWYSFVHYKMLYMIKMVRY